MRVSRPALAVALALPFLAACSGGSSTPASPIAVPSSASAPAAAAVKPQFTIGGNGSASSSASTRRAPEYVSPSYLSVEIDLVAEGTVGSPASALALLTPPVKVETDIAASASCRPSNGGSGCTVSGPAAPPNTPVEYLVTLYNATGGSSGTGAILGVASKATTLLPAVANNVSITLLGVVAQFGPPTVVMPAALRRSPQSTNVGAGTTLVAGAATTTTTFNPGVVARDAGGNTITGTFANPVTVTLAPIPEAVPASGIRLANSTTPGTVGTSAVLNTGSDAINGTYGGLALPASTLTYTTAAGALAGDTTLGGTAQVSLPAANSGIASIATTLKPISVALTPNASPISLYAPPGTNPGSTGSAAASEDGWTNAPFSQPLTLTTTCATASPFATITGSGTPNNTAVAVATTSSSAANAPSGGTCAFTLADFTGGQTSTTSIVYTSAPIFVINAKGRASH